MFGMSMQVQILDILLIKLKMAIKTIIRQATEKELADAKKRQEKKNPKPTEAEKK